MNKEIRIGTSGWHYKHWRGTFYPADVKAVDHFSYFSQRFNTVELNSPFYRLPDPETFINWKNAAPPDFLYSVKASRFITHMKKLKDPAETIYKFIDRVHLLDTTLGPILFQLPPTWKLNLTRLEEFLFVLPTHFKYTFEFRNHTWYHDDVYRLLRKYNCAFCIYDLESHLSPIETTADFVYIRLHGPTLKYVGSYPDDTLREWASQCLEWAADKDVFVYFDNDIGTAAPYDAQRLIQLVSEAD